MEFHAMDVLALDTTTVQGSVALAREGNLLDAATLPAGWSSTTLHSEIARLLGRYGLATRDIQGYGVTTGPGSFTGVRLGLTAIKGRAEVHGKPIVPVSTLQTLAAGAQLACRPSPPGALVAILDARRGQIFGAAYREVDGWLSAMLEECVCSLGSFLERVKTSVRVSIHGAAPPDLVFCGTDLDPFVPEIEKAGWGRTSMIPVPPLLAGPLALMATLRLQKGLGVSALDAEANYVRSSDAELFWKE